MSLLSLKLLTNLRYRQENISWQLKATLVSPFSSSCPPSDGNHEAMSCNSPSHQQERFGQPRRLACVSCVSNPSSETHAMVVKNPTHFAHWGRADLPRRLHFLENLYECDALGDRGRAEEPDTAADRMADRETGPCMYFVRIRSNNHRLDVLLYFLMASLQDQCDAIVSSAVRPRKKSPRVRTAVMTSGEPARPSSSMLSTMAVHSILSAPTPSSVKSCQSLEALTAKPEEKPVRSRQETAPLRKRTV